jgi:hypothetical protein
MRSRRSFTEAVPAINAAAEALPFDDASIDAAMAIFTVTSGLTRLGVWPSCVASPAGRWWS